MRKLLAGKVAAVAWTMLAVAGAAHAAPGEDEQRKVWDDVAQAAKKGPVDVPLLGEAVLHVPAGEVFVPQPQADRLLNLLGNPGRHREVAGLLPPRAPDATWSLQVRFRKSGHARDDDATPWDAEEMLRRLREGAEAQNRERLKSGLPGVELVGWSEPPSHDAALHRLSWATTSRPTGAAPDDPPVVEDNDCALGRDGYFCMTGVTSPKELGALGPVAQQQLAALEFLPGKLRADLDSKSDRVAGYGLAALVVANSGASRAALAARYLKWALPVVAVLAVALATALRRKPRNPFPRSPHGA